ncbi:MAG: PQQ-binding-like beta-propeller repeat protein [Planctomycetes bacterium]|nr:PQQ-binding-like beta-propeller repeat protein [Planctomycetota bacterium]
MIRCLSQTGLLCATFVVCGMMSASAQEWTRFRGPNGTGESEAKSIPAAWTDKDFNFKVSVPGIGHSSPVLWGDRIFLLSADPQTATRYALCYDVNGKKLWEKSFPSQMFRIHAQSSFASSTPTVDESHVYFAWAAPDAITLIAMTHDGETVWTRDLGTWSSQHGFGTSPILYKDLVILSNSQEVKDGPEPACSMVAVDKKTGEDRWKTARHSVNTSYSVPAIFQPRGSDPELVCTNTGDGLFALDPLTGKPLWSNAFFDKRTVSSPLVKGDMIFGSTGSGGGGNYLVAAQSDGREPKLAYKISAAAPYVPTTVARGDLLFLMSDGGVATCIDLHSGKVHWTERIGGKYSSSLVRAGDKIYCPSMDGEVVVFAADKVFKELGRSSLGEETRSTPAIADGRMYLRTYSHLISIGGTVTASTGAK